jgi:phosphoribosyl-ATP pyrophosphohydrolase
MSNIKCDCGHFIKDHHSIGADMRGACKKCACIWYHQKWYHQNFKYIQKKNMKNFDNPRIKVVDETVEYTIRRVHGELLNRIKKKGDKSYASNHEALGIITEEFWELVQAIQSNKQKDIISEAFDVAIGCLWLIASEVEKGASK